MTVQKIIRFGLTLGLLTSLGLSSVAQAAPATAPANRKHGANVSRGPTILHPTLSLICECQLRRTERRVPGQAHGEACEFEFGADGSRMPASARIISGTQAIT